MTAASNFERMAGKAPSLLEFGSPFADCSMSPCSSYDFPTELMEDVRRYGAIPFLSWGSQSTPWVSSAPESNGPNIGLADLRSGVYDSYIRRFASEAAAWGHPFFLRFDWEMNGDWFPWGEDINGNSPGEFVRAWRHVHDIFKSAGATNATWVWCPYVNRTESLTSLYPGDDYVDWTCLDGYNWGPNAALPRPWRSFSSLFDSAYRQIADGIAPDKPMVVGETASTEFGGSKAAWIEEMFKELPAEFPKIRGLLWFERSDSGMDWPLESSESSAAAFAAAIRDSRYVPNTFGGLDSAPIAAPEGP
jgi:hypothetical protein